MHLKSLVKQVAAFVAVKTRLYQLFLRGKAIVVVFHRIRQDAQGDPIGCHESEFVRFCEFFARYFRVVSVQDLLNRMKRGDRLDCHLAITFDDGYLDNFEVAAPVLRDRGLPACFFVATGFIGTDRVPGWDLDSGNVVSWMNWDQVRVLHRKGFEIGAHTVNHVNLGDAETSRIHGASPLPPAWRVEVDRQQALREISESRTQLAQALGSRVALFCYPFGRRENMAEYNRAAVRDAGFECCMSAFGGLVSSDTDPYDLPRVPVGQWHESPLDFLFDIMRMGVEKTT